MENQTNPPFKVGDLMESKSFQIGYRGAWFRCKIRDITKKQQRHVYILEYYDFPDEKLKRMRVYQVPPYPEGNAKERQRELMLRPQYPPIYNKKQMPHVSEISEVMVIVDNSWKVGDLVDWWTTDCYWCGKITKLLGDNMAQIELNPPPLGEGSSYEVYLKDVRPSLDWSPEHGWKLLSQEGDTGPPCSRLIKPVNHVPEELNSQRTVEMEKSGAVSNKEAKNDEEKSMSSERRRSSEAVALDTLEAAVMELEEYLNKVKWLKKILQYGTGIASSDAPKWEIVESNSAE